MKLLTILAISAGLLTASQAMEKPSFHTKGTPTGKPTGTLKPGEYWWNPKLSRSGPVVVLVSIPQQTMHVYRNGILIGRSTVSTGTKGHSTPGGVFSILEKKQTHFSKTYDNAPMPYMQRLTWSGIAMHSGQLPGREARRWMGVTSQGRPVEAGQIASRIRFNTDFAQRLSDQLRPGTTVIVTDQPVVRNPVADSTYFATK
jgi:L,D-transpeptidase catalytic domain